MNRHRGNTGGRSDAGLVLRLAMCTAALVVLTATPAFASHGGCPHNDSQTADAEDEPVETDTATLDSCVEDFGHFPRSRGGGDVDAGDDDIVPAVRIDTGAGGVATGGNPSTILGVLSGATAAIGAVAVRRRR